jgi:hypothetical protein
MTTDDFRGRKGRIYVARKGTITVLIFEDGSKCWRPAGNPGVDFSQKKLSDSYWVGSIDWSGGFSDFMIFGMRYDPEDKPCYPKASPLDPLTAERIAKLEAHFGHPKQI